VLERYSPALVTWMDQGGAVAYPLLRGPRDPRGARSGGSGARPMAVDDLVAAAEHLRGPAPGRRIAIVGEGHGAVLAIRAARLRPDLFAAVGAIDPAGRLDGPVTAALPPVMILFGLADDSGVASHGARLASTLQAAPNHGPVLTRISSASGMRRSPLPAQIDAWTDLLAFLEHALGAR
jgi:prolyl oligopeptidase PreP (S9A serine peptidase family)